MSDTPRTDAEIIFPGGGIAMVRPEFAKRLEREISELVAALRWTFDRVGEPYRQKQAAEFESWQSAEFLLMRHEARDLK